MPGSKKTPARSAQPSTSTVAAVSGAVLGVKVM